MYGELRNIKMFGTAAIGMLSCWKWSGWSHDTLDSNCIIITAALTGSLLWWVPVPILALPTAGNQIKVFDSHALVIRNSGLGMGITLGISVKCYHSLLIEVKSHLVVYLLLTSIFTSFLHRKCLIFSIWPSGSLLPPHTVCAFPENHHFRWSQN